jgi:FtsZ-binding cell division protein ZapB
LRDYWKKRGVTKKEGKKKREKKKKKKERKGKEEANGTDQDSESTLDGAQLDPTKLTTLTSRHENPFGNLPQDINSNRTSIDLEGIPSSSQQSISVAFQDDEVSEVESINLTDFENISDDGGISPSPPRSTTGAEDTDMEGDPPSNQEEVGTPDTTGTPAQVQDNHESISNDPALQTSSEQTETQVSSESTSAIQSQSPPPENLLEEGATSILTVDIFNKIVKSSRDKTPIHNHQTDLDFFRIKEERYLKHLHKFQNDDGNYTVSHPVAMALALAVETEQRNKNYIYAQNEYQMTHLRNILESAHFAGRIRDEVTEKITKHIIENLALPVEESRTQLEEYTKTVLNKLEEHERKLDGQKELRLNNGFLSRTREEHEAEVLGFRITMLEENNKSLESERDELARLNKGVNDQMSKLREEKASWQNKFLAMLEGNKRPRSDDTDSSEAKRRPSISKSTSILTDNSLSILNDDVVSGSAPLYPSISLDISHSSSSVADVEHSSNTAAFQIIASHPPRSTNLSTSPDRHRRQDTMKELDEEGKAAIRSYLNVDFDPWGENLTEHQRGQVTIGLWKLELRKKERYVPEYPDEKATHFHITHSSNMRVCLRAMDLFARITDRGSYDQCLHESQDDFEKFHLRNHIPRIISSYWAILNAPKMAAFQRCIPLRHYYDEIAQDSPGFELSALPRHHPLRAASESNSNPRNSTRFNTSDRNSNSRNSSSRNSAHFNNSDRNSNAFQTNRNSTSMGSSERSSRSLDPDPLYTWANAKFTQNLSRRYHADRLSLEEIEEVSRLTELVDLIKRGKAPKYYTSMRDQDIMRARSTRAQSLEPPPWLQGNSISGNSYTQLANMYDAYQTILIQSRATEITNSAADEADENLSDGPGGQDGQ